MKAILTKIIPCTNTKPTRIKVYTEGGNSLILSWSTCDDEGRTQGQAHLFAARKLCDNLKWEGVLIGGGTIEGYCFTFADSPIRESFPTFYRRSKAERHKADGLLVPAITEPVRSELSA